MNRGCHNEANATLHYPVITCYEEEVSDQMERNNSELTYQQAVVWPTHIKEDMDRIVGPHKVEGYKLQSISVNKIKVHGS